MMWRIGISLAAAAVILTNGLVEGVWTNRWHQSAAVESGIQQLARLPMTIGDWHGSTCEEIDEAQRIRAGIDGYIFRNYESPHLKDRKFTVLLMCGRPGPLGVHTPDICYRGAGFRQVGTIAKWPRQSQAQSADFFRGKFSKDDATDPISLRIAWSWYANGKWVTPTNPRMEFARLPVLYKMYVIHRETAASEKADEEICASFLEQLLPVLNVTLGASNNSGVQVSCR
jgi:hypothetical protein